ncbi:hypothetical protein CYMTET_55146 [Cymbomonas tetramitiformis]|uniref:Uncharacterized protein n=1 Tax=Cymbomonas tetramitiformis TaxID=36881 RepID=A0AAE0EQ04_9CHLO|nr:hypothetical protein CYMTET_55146 [Cymbomonas tetramitiformis]
MSHSVDESPARLSHPQDEESQFVCLPLPLHVKTIPGGGVLYARTVPIVNFDDADDVIVQTWATYIERKKMLCLKQIRPATVSANPVVHFITDSRKLRRSDIMKDSHIVVGASVNELPSYQKTDVRAVFDNACSIRNEKGVPFAYNEGNYGAIMSHKVGTSGLRLIDMENKENLRLLDRIGDIMHESESPIWSPTNKMWNLKGYESYEWMDKLRKNWYDEEHGEYRRVAVKPNMDPFLSILHKYVAREDGPIEKVHGVIYAEEKEHSDAEKIVCLFDPHKHVLSNTIGPGVLIQRADQRSREKYARMGLPTLDEFVGDRSNASRTLKREKGSFSTALYSHDK